MAEPRLTPLASQDEAETCAAMMAATEPWLTLGRDLQACLESITHPDKEVYLLKGAAGDQGGEILGFAVLNMHGAFTGYIQSLVVAPDLRGQGLGSRLLEFAQERIFGEQPNVFICVSSFNPRAKALYLRHGFEEVGELKDWIVAGHSEILLRKTKGPLNGLKIS